MNEREIALAAVNRAIEPLHRIDDLYNTAVNLTQQSEATVTTSGANRTRTGTILAIILGLVTFRLIGLLASKILDGDTAISVVLGLVVVIGAIIAGISVYKLIKKKFSAPSSAATNLAVRNESQIKQISAEIERVATENAAAIDALPRDYRYYFAAQFFESALANGRADTMKEAVNLFEDELHKMRMESMSQRTLRANEQQCRMLATIEDNSRRAANAAEANLAFDVLYFLSR